jgi:deoxyribonuclease V
MQIHRLHSWDVTPTEAVKLQRGMADRVESRTPLSKWDFVASADISYNRFDPIFYASAVVYRASTGEVVECSNAVRRGTFPYVPGLLSFREAPALLEAFEQLKTVPDVVMIDGHGLAHPRRMGIAAHLGLFLKVPTVGCAKTRLCGTYKEPRAAPGSLAPLMHGGEQVGYVVRTKKNVKPLFVSVGHMIDLASAVRVVLGTTKGYRHPEPTRQAHLRVNELRRTGSCTAQCESL